MWKRPCREIVCVFFVRVGTHEHLGAPGAPGEKGGGEREIYIVCVCGRDTGSDPWSEGTFANVSVFSTLLVGLCAFARA
jgi:hypothetical protein